MKTSQDFNENFNQYSSEIEKEMSNLNRMLQEFASNGVVAQQIINDLEPVLAKLHLTIDSFTMNRPDKEKASNRGRLSLHLVSDGKFKFIQFRGYTSRGAGKNESRLDTLVKQAEEPALFFAGITAWKKVCNGEPTGYPISLDATSSGK